MDLSSFPTFVDFLKGTEEIAHSTGYRFRLTDFDIPVVDQYLQKVKARDPLLLQDIARAHKVSEQEGIRNVMISTCKELDLWPPCGEDRLQSIAYTDVSEPLDHIAWALFNYDKSIDEIRSNHESQCRTASFIVDFAHAAGERTEMSKAGSELLIRFLQRAKEWTDSHNLKRPSLRRTVIDKIAEFADDAFIAEIDAWLDRHWEAVAVGAIALVAGFALAALAFGGRHRD